MIDKVCRGLDHAPSIAGGANGAALPGERDQEIMTALPATRPGKAIGKDGALKILAKLPLDVCRHGIAIRVVFPCEREVGLQVLLDDTVENRALRMATGIRYESTSL
jgi:hypothetical protein